MTKTALVVISDLHVNSTVAICPPAINLDDGGSYHQSRTQSWLWRSMLDFTRQVEIDTADCSRRILVINGDLGELDTQKRSIQLITLNKATVLSVVVKTLEPLLALVEKTIIMRGTAAHTGKSSWLEEATAKDLDGVIPQAKDIYSHWHYRGVCEGVRLDIAHHANTNGAPWGVGAGALKLASKTVWHYRVSRHIDPPHLVIRSHNHQYSDSGGNFETHAIFTPAWTSATEYAYRIGHENTLADIGGIVITCEDGRYSVRKYLYEPKESRRVWAMTL